MNLILRDQGKECISLEKKNSKPILSSKSCQTERLKFWFGPIRSGDQVKFV